MKRYLMLIFVSYLLVGCGGVATPIAVPPADASIGDTWIRPADGAVMVFVPAGEFLMGSTDNDTAALAIEKPQHTVYLDGFWVDKHEVTNAQYRKCMEAGACEETVCWDSGVLNAPDQPVVCVTWSDAQAYAAWVGGRLPTEAEWEKSARGTDGRIYPWGNSALDCSKANYKGCADWPLPVGSHPDGASPYGALDMAGNAWEWAADWYDADYYIGSPVQNPQGPESGNHRVLRGGAVSGNERMVRCANRFKAVPGHRVGNTGIRVVVAPGDG